MSHCDFCICLLHAACAALQSTYAMRCASCGGALERLRMCPVCRVAAYCDARCQKAHWDAGHRRLCSKKEARVYM
jgi:hypothetical protein